MEKCSFFGNSGPCFGELMSLMSLTDGEKDVRSHLRYLKVGGGKTEIDLILYRSGFFDVEESCRRLLLICRGHRDALGIYWKKTSAKCGYPLHNGKCKPDRAVDFNVSREIFYLFQVIVPVGSGICKLCRTNHPRLVEARAHRNINEREAEFQALVHEGDKHQSPSSLPQIHIATPKESDLKSNHSQTENQCNSSQFSECSTSVFSQSSHEEWLPETSELEKVNCIIHQISDDRVSPLRSQLSTPWDEASSRTKNYYRKQTYDVIKELVEHIAPKQSAVILTEIFQKYFLSVNNSNDYFVSMVASYQEAGSPFLKRQILSLFANQYSKETLLNAIPGLTKHKIDSARKYAVVNRPDQLDYSSVVSLKLPTDKVQHFVSFVSQPHFIQDVAFGERTLKLSTGQKVHIPDVVRTVIGSRIISAYLAYCAEVNFTALKRSSLYHILKQCSASQRKSLCGLDSITADGMASFDRLMSLSDNMQTYSANTRENVFKSVHWFVWSSSPGWFYPRSLADRTDREDRSTAMNVVEIVFVLVVAALAAFLGFQVQLNSLKPDFTTRVIRDLTPDQELVQHSKEFQTKEIRKVSDNIYMGIGYALGNAIMIIAPDGLIIVDVTESSMAAREILAEFRKITKKPIKAIIYTHHHTDHIGGVGGFIEDSDNLPDIWAHEHLPLEIRKFHTTAYGAKFKRSMRQFGVFVTKARYQNAGIGIQLNYGKAKDSMGFILPNKLLTDVELDTNIAGLEVRLMKIPGETSDQIGLWVPSFKAFMCADDIYRAFPNIYTIRGAPARDPVDWYTSLQRMLDLEPEYLVPSHTQPISGKDNVRAVLEVYRDGIQFVHDQAVRFINKGYSPDDVVKHVTMPDKLRLHPHLREFYGTVPWSVKGVFQLYLGWFSGDPVDLFPLSNIDKARRVVGLTGGVSEVLSAAFKAWNDNDIQWALELASYILVVDERNVEARKLKIDCLTLLGIRNINAIASNYYITTALETSGSLQLEIDDKHREDIILALGARELFELVSTMYKYEECGGRSDVVVFEITDKNQLYTIQLRNFVAIVRDDLKPNKYDLKVTAPEKAVKQMMIERVPNVRLKDLKDFQLEGNEEKFRSFMACFESDWNK